MNYITETKAFYDLLETTKLSSSAILLWHALMHIANKTGWRQEFAVAISVLEMKTSLKVKTIERARNSLAQAGLISWHKRDGNQSAVYRMNSLCDRISYQPVAQNLLCDKTDHQNVTQSDTQSDTQTVAQDVAQDVVQTVAQTVAINKQKLNKTRQEREGERPPFLKPTQEEVAAYCRQNNMTVDAARFFDYYSARGWLAGKAPMCDWRAAVRTWAGNSFNQKPATQGGAKSSYDIDEFEQYLLHKPPK